MSLPSPVAGVTSASNEELASVPETVSQPHPALSKNAQKRLLKAQRNEEFKTERRARDKALKKAKKAAIREKRARGELDDDEEEKARQTKRQKVSQDGPREKFGARLVIDLGFDDKMTDREIVSLVSQCAYSYSSNRKSLHPFTSLLFTSLNGRTYRRFEDLKTYRHWKNVEWWDQGYERLWRSENTSESVELLTPSEKGHAERSNSAIPTDKVSTRHPCEDTVFCPETQRSQAPKSSVVYLTADSPDELLELKEGETYIIGGICDKNRYKNLCEGKAKSQGIRTARLPIGVFLSELPTRKVLTINQVCDILLYWIAAHDWKAAFYAVVPPRKFEKGKKAEKLRKRKERRAGNIECEVNPDEGDFEFKDAAPEEDMAAESSSDTNDEGSMQANLCHARTGSQ